MPSESYTQPDSRMRYIHSQWTELHIELIMIYDKKHSLHKSKIENVRMCLYMPVCVCVCACNTAVGGKACKQIMIIIKQCIAWLH
jgi:hypothetical protein